MIEPILSDKGRKSTCPDCGYSWTTGADGAHDCDPAHTLDAALARDFTALVGGEPQCQSQPSKVSDGSVSDGASASTITASPSGASGGSTTQSAGSGATSQNQSGPSSPLVSKPISSADLEAGVQQWLQSQFAALRPADPVITQLITDAKSLDVSNSSARTFAADLQKDLKRRRELWEAQIKRIKVAIDALKKPVLDLEKRETQKYIDAADALSAKCTRYDAEIARQVREENEKRIREAEDKARMEREVELIAKKARLKAVEQTLQVPGPYAGIAQQEAKDLRQELREIKAAPLDVPPIQILEAPKKPQGQHDREYLEIEITDFALVPQKFKDDALSAYLGSQTFINDVSVLLLALFKKQRALFKEPGCKGNTRTKLITK